MTQCFSYDYSSLAPAEQFTGWCEVGDGASVQLFVTDTNGAGGYSGSVRVLVSNDNTKPESGVNALQKRAIEEHVVNGENIANELSALFVISKPVRWFGVVVYKDQSGQISPGDVMVHIFMHSNNA